MDQKDFHKSSKQRKSFTADMTSTIFALLGALIFLGGIIGMFSIKKESIPYAGLYVGLFYFTIAGAGLIILIASAIIFLIKGFSK